MHEGLPPDFEELVLRWRRVTREWLAARNAVASLQGIPALDITCASAAYRRLEHAERQREALVRHMEAVRAQLDERRP